jgi:putative FmdB family regulatory protein
VPTYDYKCEACNHKWEELQSIKASPTKKCPGCGKLKAQRQIGGGAGLIFKGSGFYLTDYRSDSYKKAAEADKKAAAGDSSPKSDSSSSPEADSGKKGSE